MAAYVICMAVFILSQPTHSSGGTLDDISLKHESLIKQMMMNDMMITDCPSGIKSIRSQRSGTKPYNTEWHNSFKIIAIHNHADHLKVVGLGEFGVCLNGVEFRTRHNDYSLVQPVSNDKTYHAVKKIEFPPVPPQVLRKTRVTDQILEMRKCFQAWKEQSTKLCNYKKYFKPIMCYLEGAWTVSNDGKVEEGFKSDRHFTDALNWDELHAKARYSAFSGYKDNKENFVLLPTMISSSFDKVQSPKLYQWNYRILCHHLKNDLPTSKFRYVDHLMDRADMTYTIDKQIKSNGAQFSLDYESSGSGASTAKPVRHSMLDELMAEIPGKDNYGAFIPDNPCNRQSLNFTTGKAINAAYYNRWYKVGMTGPSRQSEIHRGFNDPHVFMAKTTNSKVAGVRVSCDCDSSGKCKYDQIERWTYAIPLEVIYLTPLSMWNPHNIEYKGDDTSKAGKTVRANGRNGSKTDKRKAYDGNHSKLYYVTPSSLFGGKEVNKDAADTAADVVGVLNKRGQLVHVAATGIRVFLPEIPSVGILRQRYPIPPFNAESFGTYKELAAVRDAILEKSSFPFMFPKVNSVKPASNVKTNPVPKKTNPVPKKTNPVPQKTNPTVHKKTTNIPIPKLRMYQVNNAKNYKLKHTHDVRLTKAQLATLIASTRNTVVVKTGLGDGHVHTLTLRRRATDGTFIYTKCDHRVTCFGNHNKYLIDCGKLKTRPECAK